MSSPSSLPICTACGSQFNISDPKDCKICLDPRQFVPPSGQSWTTLSRLRGTHTNTIERDNIDDRIWSIYTIPKFAIGQRAMLLETPHGNILWDMITLLDEKTARFIDGKGGIKAIVISHPHYYTTYVEWAERFKCPVYISVDDKEWLYREPPEEGMIRFIEGPAGSVEEIVPGVTAIKTGGHFKGSLVLHWEEKLFIADTIVTVPVSCYNSIAFPLRYSITIKG